MALIKNFKEISKSDVLTAGGKGASLGEMTRARIPVPSGFVILAGAFDRFLEETDLNVEIDAALDKVSIKKVHTTEKASEKIRAMILSKEIPEDIKETILKNSNKLGTEFVAVRSSATSEDSASAAWAGQLDSFLNTTKETLLENVKKCWASLFTPRAIFYRFEKRLNKDKISVAVVVQKMIDSEESGIAFSVHPITQDANQIIIEAGFGLGEAIVSGAITPDSYVVDKQDLKILDINVNEQTKALYRKSRGENEWRELGKKGKSQVLSKKEIIGLSKLIIKIENHYGFPCDIEWAKEKGKFYIVQSRPITTLIKIKDKEKKQSGLVFEKSITRDWGIIYGELWHRIFTEEFKKQIGWHYSEVVFEGKENTISIYRAPIEHIIGMRNYILNQLNKNPNWIKDHARKVKKQVDDVISWCDKIKKKEMNKYSLKKMANITKIFMEKNVELGPRFIMMLWFPIQMENYEKHKKYKKAIDVAIKTRAYIEKIGPFADLFGRALTLEVANRTNIPKKLSKYISYNEVLDYFENKKIVNVNILKKRQNYFIITNNGILYENIENYLEKHGNLLKKEKIEGILEIKGNTAYGGVVRGKIKIIRNKNEFKKLEDGEILVTGMTTPDYLPIINKASAFITDEGGITCHAAIVSREIKKPCIIGTKSATMILKDGDYVEVDANSGVVRILEK